jgi:hypothetical protein
VRATEDAAADPLSVRADLPAQPRVMGDGKVASVAVSPAASDHADRKPSNLVQSDDARLPPLGQHTPEAPAAALALASEQSTISAFAAATPKASEHASIDASPESVSAPAVAEPTTEARAFAAPDSLQMLLLAIFCGPAFYLLAAGTIRRLRPVEVARRPLPYIISLDDASGHRALLPPRLEANEDTVAS